MKEKENFKKKKLFKNKYWCALYIIVVLILLSFFIIIGRMDFNNKINDNERFHDDFPMVPKNNVFKYVDVVDVHFIAKGKDGIVLFGHKNNKWVEYYAYLVNKVAQDVGIKEIYYYDFYDDRRMNNATYEDILNEMSEYVVTNDMGKREIYAPTLLVVHDGKIILFDDTTSFIKGNINPQEYYSEDVYIEVIGRLKNIFMDFIGRTNESK